MKTKHLFKSFLLVSIAALTFVACGKKKDNKTKVNPIVTTTSTPDPTPDVNPVLNNKKCYFSNSNDYFVFKTDVEDEKLTNLYLLNGMSEAYVFKPICENGKIKSVQIVPSTNNEYIDQYLLLEEKDLFIPFADSYHEYFDEYCFSNLSSYSYVKFTDNKIIIKNESNSYSFDIDGSISDNLSLVGSNTSINYFGFKMNLSLNNDILSYDFYSDNTNKTKNTITLSKNSIIVPDLFDNKADVLEFNGNTIKTCERRYNANGTTSDFYSSTMVLDENKKVTSQNILSDSNNNYYYTYTYDGNTKTVKCYTDENLTNCENKFIYTYDEYNRITSYKYYDIESNNNEVLQSEKSYEYNDQGLIKKYYYEYAGYFSYSGTITYTYRDDEKLSKVEYYEAGNNPTNYKTYEYTNNLLTKISYYDLNSNNEYYIEEESVYSYDVIDGYKVTTQILTGYNDDSSVDYTIKYVYKVKDNDSIWEEYTNHSSTYKLNIRSRKINTEPGIFKKYDEYFDASENYDYRDIITYNIGNLPRLAMDDRNIYDRLQTKYEHEKYDTNTKQFYLTSCSYYNEDGNKEYGYTYTYNDNKEIIKTVYAEYETNQFGNSIKVLEYEENEDLVNNYLVKNVKEYFKPNEDYSGQLKIEGIFNYDLDNKDLLLSASYTLYEIENNTKVLRHVDYSFDKATNTKTTKKYGYDTNNRISEMYESIIDSNNIETKTKYVYSYNYDNTIAKKIVMPFIESINEYRETEEYKYYNEQIDDIIKTYYNDDYSVITYKEEYDYYEGELDYLNIKVDYNNDGDFVYTHQYEYNNEEKILIWRAEYDENENIIFDVSPDYYYDDDDIKRDVIVVITYKSDGSAEKGYMYENFESGKHKLYTSKESIIIEGPYTFFEINNYDLSDTLYDGTITIENAIVPVIE